MITKAELDALPLGQRNVWLRADVLRQRIRLLKLMGEAGADQPELIVEAQALLERLNETAGALVASARDLRTLIFEEPQGNA